MDRTRHFIFAALVTLALAACGRAATPTPDSGQAVNPTAESTPAPAATAAATEPAAEPTTAAIEATSTVLLTIAPEPTGTTPVRGTPVPAEPTETPDPVRGTPVPLPTDGPVDDDLGLAVPLTTELLKNSTYLPPSGYGDPIELVDGLYQDQSDPNMPLTVRLLEETIAYGDVDGDGIEDAVVPLATNTGGSGVFMDIVLMSGESGTAAQIASAYLGDRVIINEITAQLELVTVNMVIAGPNDPSCCPTQEVTVTYAYREGTLTLFE
jgi:hypothetical protein